MNSNALFSSTWFQVIPSTFRDDPTIAPSAIFKISSTLEILTPVFAKTGIVFIIFLTEDNSFISADSPVMGPDTNIASGKEEKATLLALSANDLLSIEWANSALILKNSSKFS